MSGELVRKMIALSWRVRCLWAARTAGRMSRAILRAGQPRRILVVCYGNIYRSPYAAVHLRERLAGFCDVRSAGFHSVAGRPSPAAPIALALRTGVDLTAHRSAVVSLADLTWADAIVLMDRHNWQALVKLGAEPRKLVWLGIFDDGGELPDPYGRPQADVERIMRRVHRCVDLLADQIIAHRRSPAA